MQEMQQMGGRSPGWENPLEEEMAAHSSILVWEILWTEEPDVLQSMGSQTAGHDRAHTHNTSPLSHYRLSSGKQA